MESRSHPTHQVLPIWRKLWSSLVVIVLLTILASRFLLRDGPHASARMVGLLRAPATEEPPQSHDREAQLLPHRPVSTSRVRGFEPYQSERQAEAAAEQALQSLRKMVWQQDTIIRRHRIKLRKLDADFEAWKRDGPDRIPAAAALMNKYRMEAKNLLRQLKDVGNGVRTGMEDAHKLPTVLPDYVKPKGGEACFSDGIRNAIQRLPPGIVHATTDLYQRAIWEVPMEDGSSQQPRNLLAMAIGINEKVNVDRMIQKFPAENFTLLLFHYDESSYQDWNQFSWNSRAVHVQVPSQGKWWYAKRFLHPSLVEPYAYVFFFDEDLDVTNFNSVRYLEMMKAHDLDISQPALFPYVNVHFELTKLVNSSDVHKRTNARIHSFNRANRNMCVEGSNDTPCAGLVEMMAPVFTRNAWTCVWHMIQNDLVLGWGMDWKFGACVNGLPHEKMGIIDTDFVTHISTQSLGGENDQGRPLTGKQKPLRAKMAKRRWIEHDLFLERWAAAEKAGENSSV